MSAPFSPRLPRRGFLARLGALAGATALFPMDLEARPLGQGGWDMSWLDGLTGKHKQVFDFGHPDLMVVRNWLDAHETVYGLRYPEVNTVVGIASNSFPVNATDAAYERYPIGEMWKITDPATGKPARRNIYLDGGDTPDEQSMTVRALQARGTIFWQCNNALHGVSKWIASKVNGNADDVYADLRAHGLNAGVILVPAHTMLVGLCQERGCAYELLF